MKKRFLFLISGFLFTLFSFNSFAFECPVHFQVAQAKIDKVLVDMKIMDKKIAKQEMALVHTLIDDAKMYLSSAQHNHEKPQGAYDHARAMAKADTALGYANAADKLHWAYMQKSK
ncbi:hypothetical protein [Psychromonas hadalis]|uniref:hypothetical protein n=1 Tax=Psychromonas hadalis TaxID=211669 RepID=UPI0003B6B53C|nr:hypothetical protein [Psychromonas hadalis]